MPIMWLLAQANPDNYIGWWQWLATTFGAPGAILIAFLFAGHRGWVRWGREVVREQDERTKRDTEWKERYDAMEREKNLWRDLVLQQQHVTQRAVETAKSATEQLAGVKASP